MQHSFPDRGTIDAMIGTKAILQDAAFIALGLFLFSGSLWSLLSVRRAERAGKFSKKAVDDYYLWSFLLVFSLLFLAAVGHHLVREVLFHSQLSQLRADTVDRIEVGNQAITDPEHIALIVHVLNQPEGSRRDVATAPMKFHLSFDSAMDASTSTQPRVICTGKALL